MHAPGGVKSRRKQPYTAAMPDALKPDLAERVLDRAGGLEAA